VAVEQLLNLLIGVVDAKLLKAVFLKVLKAKDVQESNEAVSGGVLRINEAMNIRRKKRKRRRKSGK